jgi:hypothetical protein
VVFENGEAQVVDFDDRVHSQVCITPRFQGRPQSGSRARRRQSAAQRDDHPRPPRDVALPRAEELDLKDERGVGWNDSARAALAVAEGRRDHERALLAHLHRRYALVPALDHAPMPSGNSNGLRDRVSCRTSFRR